MLRMPVFLLVIKKQTANFVKSAEKVPENYIPIRCYSNEAEIKSWLKTLNESQQKRIQFTNECQ